MLCKVYFLLKSLVNAEKSLFFVVFVEKLTFIRNGCIINDFAFIMIYDLAPKHSIFLFCVFGIC